MKFFLIFALVVVALASVEGSPKGKGNKKTCNLACAASYEPVCAQDSSVKGSRPRTFGSRCVMELHNCENTAAMEVLYEGECKGAGGVRIS
ncbi:UNVERIFIED_CONTAM: hypothetical protein PYX00_007543 [Menopon gallinae]|uniref:Kazal-like domain-containing protein n=1 Tax=Menopon gallinae TaxID=328185 RepID=A0AAW2HKJ7_9NEOP